MIVGFTGTRKALTGHQMMALQRVMSELEQQAVDVDRPEVHHGCCVGADETLHNFAWMRGWRITVHPPRDERHRAVLDQWDASRCVLLPEEDYLARNHAIVAASDVLVAAPSGPATMRSGTWSTVRHATAHDVPVVVIRPSGQVDRMLGPPEAPPDEERYRIYQVRDADELVLVATAPTPAAVGMALVTLSDEGEFGDGSRVGVLDSERRRWIVLPWMTQTREENA